MNSRKLISAFLMASTVVWGLGIATLPLANAQTTASLQAQIAALLAQIQQLQAQLNAAQGGSSSTASVSCSFTRDLTVGSTGSDVKCLQQYLNANGAQVAASGAGSPGNETTYFGGLTKAALAKYQAAHGIAPAAGYFGPITQAFIASQSVASTGTGTGTSTSTTGTVTPPTTGLAVSLASDNPAAGSLISSAGSAAARVPVLAVNLTASNSGAVTVTDLKLHKTGVLSDSSIAGAYLVQNGQVLYQYTSLNQGVIDFSNMDFTVPAGQTEELQLAIDPSTGLAAGNTVGFAMTSASDITAVNASNNAVTPAGSFPITGNIFTVTSVSNPSLATLSVASSSVATQVTAGSQNNIVGAWTFSGQNSLTYLKGIKFTVIGSANNADIRNVKLSVNGTQVGPTLPTVSSDGTAYFDLSSAPASLNTGGNNVQVYADVMGSPNKNFQFEILNTYDVYAIDSQYNVPISVSVNGGAGTQVQIQQGTITVTQDSSTPTGNIAVGQSGVTLAKYDIYAAGEPVKVKYLGFELAFTGLNTASDTSLSQVVKNIALVDDAGGQVGNTINTPPSGNQCDASVSGAYTSGGTWPASSVTPQSLNYVDCFGTSASPINYIVPANTTRVLSLKADIQPTANFGTVTANLLPETTDNLQGLTSSATTNSAGANGSALTLATSLLTVAANSAYGSQTVTPNSSNVKIGSYAFSASSASGVQINTVTIQPAPGRSGSANDLQNLRVMIGGTQFGTTVGSVTDGQNYTFSGSSFTVPAGGTTYVDVYANVLSTGGTNLSLTPATNLTGCSGMGVVSYNAISCSGTKAGQDVTVASEGATMSVALDSSAPASNVLVMGSTGNSLAAYNFTETSNVENVKITDLTVHQNTSATSTAYQNLTLYSGSTALGTSGAGTVGSVLVPGTPAVNASGTITVTAPTGTATTTNSSVVYVTINGHQIVGQLAASSTASGIASAVASTINSNSATVGATATSSSNVVDVTSNGIASPRISIFGTDGTITYAVVNNAGTAAVATSTTSGSGFDFAFHFNTPVVVPQGNSLVLTLKGDVAPYNSLSNTNVDNTTSTFEISPSGVTALGASSNITTNVTGSATGNQMAVLKSTATAAGASISGTPPAAFTQIGSLTVSANSAGSVQMSKVTLTFSGNAATSSLLKTVVLKDPSGNDIVAVDQFASSNASTATSSVTWTFSTSTPLNISAGNSYTLTLWADLSQVPAVANTGLNLTATIQNNTDFQYLDNTNGAGALVSLPTNAVPITASSISGPVGGQL